MPADLSGHPTIRGRTQVSAGIVVAAAMLAALAAGLWAQLRAMSAHEDALALALTGCDRFVAAETALRRNIAEARIGLVRDYDDTVRFSDDVDAARRHLLDATAPIAGVSEGAMRIGAQVSDQLAAIEEFKTQNALLRNALASFGVQGLALNDTAATPVTVAANNLSVAMLGLLLDTAPETVARASQRLRQFEQMGGLAPGLGSFGRQGRVVVGLLPAIDGVIRRLMQQPGDAETSALARAILAQQTEAQIRAHRYRVALSATCVVLVASLLLLGATLRARAGVLRRRAEFESGLTEMSHRLSGMPHAAMPSAVQKAVADIGRSLGADQAVAVFGGVQPAVAGWTADGSAWDPALERPGGATSDAAVTVEQGEAGRFGLVWGKRSSARRADADMLPMAFEMLLQARNRAQLSEERERLEISLGQARRMETIGAFASGIAHNFNNILAAILGQAEMEDEAVGPRQPGRMQAVRLAAQRGQGLVSDILTFGRVGRGRRQARDLRPLITETEGLLRQIWPQARLLVETGTRALTVHCDGVQLQQAVMNVANNALRSTDGAGLVTISIEARDGVPGSITHGMLAAVPCACIRVRDAGCGMSPGMMAQLFQPFVTDRPDGNGLGLATAWEVVRDHGGAWTVTSEEGAGSCFEVWLPLHAEPSAPTSSIAAKSGEGQAILIVNADAAALCREEDVVAALGYEPVGFLAAVPAVAEALADPARFFAYIFVSPRLDPAFCRLLGELRAALPDAPILLAVARTATTDTATLSKFGTAYVLPHPIASSELLIALNECMERQTQRYQPFKS